MISIQEAEAHGRRLMSLRGLWGSVGASDALGTEEELKETQKPQIKILCIFYFQESIL
jgi:hypothetical protein